MEEKVKKGESIKENLFPFLFTWALFTWGTGLGHSILRLFLFNGSWMLNQHSMSNIVDCFAPDTGKPKNIVGAGCRNGDVVKNWPGFWNHNIVSRFVRGFVYPLPFLNRGLLSGVVSLFSTKVNTETMMEVQSHLNALTYEEQTQQQNRVGQFYAVKYKVVPNWQ